MRMCQAFSPFLIAAKGTIVQIGSIAGIMPYVFGSTYNATKAALHAYSNTLRVELAPFGVKVITVITGGVKSNLARVDRTLAPDSIYMPLKAEYLRRTKHSQEVGMPTDQYAKTVVSQILGFRKRRFIWAGFGVNLVWFASTFLPHWVMVSCRHQQ
jgi:1-acylglycerone phosphate reductase